MKIWDNITGSLTNITSAFSTLGSTVQTVNLGKVLPKAKDLKKTKKGFSDIAGGMKLGVSSALGWVGLLIAALEALGFLEPIVNTIMSLVSIFSIGLAPILEVIIDVLMSLVPVFETLNAIIAPFAMILATLIGDALLPLAPLLNAMLLPLIPMIELLASVISFVLEMNQSMSLLPIVMGFLIPWFEFVARAMNAVLGPITGLVTGLHSIPEAIGGFISGISEKVSSFFSNLFSNIGSWLSQAVKDILDWFKNLPGQIIDVIQSAFNDTIMDFGSNIFDTIGGWFS